MSRNPRCEPKSKRPDDVAHDLRALAESANRILMPVFSVWHVHPDRMPGGSETLGEVLAHAEQHLKLIGIWLVLVVR